MFLNNAQVCLDCEKLFIGDQCPKCCSRHFFYLRKYYPPMLRFGGENGFVKEKHIQVQEGIQGLLPGILDPIDNLNLVAIEREWGYAAALQTNAFDAGYECGKEAGDRPQPRESSYQRGKLLEAICTILKGGYWANAGASPHMGTPVDKGRVAESRDEHSSGNEDIERLYKAESHIRRGPSQV